MRRLGKIYPLLFWPSEADKTGVTSIHKFSTMLLKKGPLDNESNLRRPKLILSIYLCTLRQGLHNAGLISDIPGCYNRIKSEFLISKTPYVKKFNANQ